MDLQVIGGGIAMAFSNLITYIILQKVLKRTLSHASEAFEVSWRDKRNFGQIRDYLKLGIPSMLMLMLEWSAASLMTVVAGRLGLID
jgi:Na+-driven multidrug efflux pump